MLCFMRICFKVIKIWYFKFVRGKELFGILLYVFVRIDKFGVLFIYDFVIDFYEIKVVYLLNFVW